MWRVFWGFSGASLDVKGGEIMVLYLRPLAKLIRDHVVVLEIVEKACAKWGVDSPLGDRTMTLAREGLAQVQDLLSRGFTEVKLP